MIQDASIFWQNITSYQFNNLINFNYYISKANILSYWHFLILITLIIILVAVVIKTVYATKYKNHLIYNKFAGKIFTWLVVMSIIFSLLILLTIADAKLFSLRIIYVMLLLTFFLWLMMILKWKITSFDSELIEYHKKERINKYLPRKKK